MPVQLADIAFYPSQLISDSVPAQNGGRPASTPTASGLRNGRFPDLLPAQRAAGLDTWRKEFVVLRNADDLPLRVPRLSLAAPTPGDGYGLLYPATWSDTQATRSGRPYGVGILAQNADTDDDTLTVTLEADFSGDLAPPFQSGDLIRIDAREPGADAGVWEYGTIDAATYSGSTLSIALRSGIGADYSAGAVVAAVVESGDLATAVSGQTTTGTLVYSGEIAVPQVGSIVQTWTITLVSAASGALTVVGDTLGAVASGSTGVDLAPPNPAGGSYFRVQAAGWAGGAAGDVLVFTTLPAGLPCWRRRVTPPGSGPISVDRLDLYLEGQP